MEHTCTAIGQYIFIIGGISSFKTHSSADAIVIDIKNGTFKQLELTGREPGPLYQHTACYWKDSKIIVYGGRAGKDEGLFGPKASSQVGIITILGLEEGLESIRLRWEDVQTQQAHPRASHTAHIYQNKMFVFGNKVMYLDLENWSWVKCEQRDQSEKDVFAFHISTLCENKVFLHGYQDPTANTRESQRFSVYDLTIATWTSFTSESESDNLEFQFTAIQQHKNMIYLVNTLAKSEDPLILKTFDISKNQWTVIPTNHEGPGPRTHFSLSVCENKLVLFGGYSCKGPSGTLLAELWFLPLETNTQGRMKRESKPLDKNTLVIKAFLAEAPYSDVAFEVEGQLILAHKWWLCNRSKYLANMFSSGMAEANTSKIVVSDITANTFRVFLEFLYSDHIELDSILAEELLTQADKYSVPALKKLCEEFLSEELTPDNYVKFANLSELVGADILREAVKNYIARNIKKLKEREDFEQISTEMLRDVVVKVTLK